MTKALWLALLAASIGWIAFALVEQEQRVRSWVDYHFHYERTAANYRNQQVQAKAYREQLLGQVEAAASQAEAEVRRKPGTLAKLDSQLLEYEIKKAAEKARVSKKYELTHSTGSVYLDLQNEDALAREVYVDEPPPRPSSKWLIALFAPPVTLALVH